MGFNTANDMIDNTENYSETEAIGTVVRNNDPTGIGRVQANVPNLFHSDEGEVPWVGREPDSPFGFGVGPKGPYGAYGVPPVGAFLRVRLPQGDENDALYRPFFPEQAVNPKFVPVTSWGWTDPGGNTIFYDWNTGVYEWIHQSGATVTVDASGNRTTTLPGDDSLNAKSFTVNVSGNAAINAQGSITLHAGGTATYEASSHSFKGPVQMDSTLQTAGDITDLTGSGNSQTVGNMRTAFNIHRHHYDDNGSDAITDYPFPLVPV